MEWSVSYDINTSYTSQTSSTTFSTNINENLELNDLTTNKNLKTTFI